MALGIERAHYIALRTPDPEAAANFAVDKMGLQLARRDDDSFFLSCHGLDPYSLVYVEGEHGIDRIGYLVKDEPALTRARDELRRSGVAVEDTQHYERGNGEPQPGLRFAIPGGHAVELTIGRGAQVPMAQRVHAPSAVPAPISCDHAVVRSQDMQRMFDFMTSVVGLKESARIQAPDIGDVIAFLRSKVLFHCFAYARSAYQGLHHFQMTVKNPPALYAAYDAMKAKGVEMVWGPVRHGPGHNIAFYFHDAAGNIIEYSCEEEIILNDETYVPRTWSTTDQKSLDEWGSAPPASFFE